jgi:hypothetical protein
MSHPTDPGRSRGTEVVSGASSGIGSGDGHVVVIGSGSIGPPPGAARRATSGLAVR